MLTPSERLHRTLDLSAARRVFAVGDIHGEFPLLEQILEALQFDPHRDHLVSVGDLVDRGPNSELAFEYIKKPWFHRSLGNHERFPGDYLRKRLTHLEIERGGGKWFLDKRPSEIEKIAAVLEDASYALTVLTPGGRKVGITHADNMKFWELHLHSLNKLWVKDLTVESRETIREIERREKEGIPLVRDEFTVAGIDHVFHGHTPLMNIKTVDNQTWLDTGACMGGHLTVINIDEFLERLGQ